MSWALIRAEIKTLLEAVTNIGQVHDTLRHSTTWEEMFARYKDDSQGRLLAWELTRDGEGLELEAVGNAVSVEPFYRRTHNVLIIGYMALKEDDTNPSEKTFQDLVEAVVTKLRQNNLLNEKVLLHIEPQVDSIAHEMFGSVLVHQAIIRFPAIERVGG